MPSKSFKSALPGWLSTTGLYLLTNLTFRCGAIRRKVAILNECVDHLQWLRGRFGKTNLHARRESLWKLMMGEMRGGRWTVYEFGVAWGYATNYWITQAGDCVETWHGFDRFTGLPRGWRGLPAGEFDAGGNTPPIDDPRVRWHVGDVENTLPPVPISPSPKCVLFDLDIYEPTAFAWEFMRPHLSPGDLLYFDESFDTDERRVIEEHVLKQFRLELIASTPLASCFRIVGPAGA